MGRYVRRGQDLVVDIALVGDTAWFVANLYEGLVDVPQLLIDSRPRRRPGLIAPGSPVRYFALNGLVAIPASGLALATAWRQGHRAAAGTAAGALGAAVALSGFLIRTVNVPLLTGNEGLPPARLSGLKARWHAANALRLLALGAGIVAIERTRFRRERDERP
ncbi:DUF1772 domain-containing protein [Qaidamihabitans albus]|uniref:DUF1772 domain-containing protein n=1 Tax=Qaidamihabitans albus TaxID=2795733 RepID=UPI0018F13645|nr:DUF1772 domain-containing protein [Qaidamihabitans albus]